MKTERMKSLVLLFLVTMSFVLTTRIWFNISIEGLFVMPTNNKTVQPVLAYEKGNLLKPSRLVVHTGQSHTLLFNNNKDKGAYSTTLDGAKNILKNWLDNYESYSLTSLPKEQLGELRDGRAVELIFDYPMQLDSIKSLLDAKTNPWKEINEIDSILIAPYDNKIYVVDDSKYSIYQFTATQTTTELKGAITDVEKRNDFEYVFLNEFNDIGYEYGDYAVAPVSVSIMPVPVIKSEFHAERKLTPEIAQFFNDESANISTMKDTGGEITFTDREEEAVNINANGVLEYYKYNVTSNDMKLTELTEAIDIATKYVNQHMGFTYDFYLSGIESSPLGGRTSYIISFDYKYNGTPILTKLDTGSSAIEVEILGQEVKSYKRNVRIIEDQGKFVSIRSFVDILNMVWGELDQYLNEKRAESIVVLNDMYLAYFERNDVLIPVWVVSVKVEREDKEQYNKTYIIGAEEGVILDEKDEK